MSQQEAEGEGVQPNHNNMPNSISEEPINRFPSNLGGSAHQSQLFYMPNSSSVEPSHQHPSNLGGRAHQPDQLSEPESEHEILTAAHLNYYRPLFKAAQGGDWKTAKSFIDSDPDALTAKILTVLETVLHIAARCCQWKFILMLLELDVSTPQSIAVQNVGGSTVLHIVAAGGSLKTTKALVEKNANLLQMVNNDGYLPLDYAILSKNRELVWYLSKKTRVESPSSPFFIHGLLRILCDLIQAGYHDIALYFVQRFPHLALAEDEYGDSLLTWLADNPSYFFSGCNLGIFERWIYKFVRVEIQSAYSLALQSITQGTILGGFKRLLWKAITQLAPSIKIVRDAKMTHECAVELVNHVVNQIKLSTMSYSQIRDFLLYPVPIMYVAIKGGTEEIVRALLKDFPDLMFVQARPQRNILQAAIECRQENIVNVLKEISPLTVYALCSADRGNITTLHLAANLAPAFKLCSVSGAALQMQRELQWFKEVEMYTLPGNIGRKYSKGQTAKDAFRLAHEKLAKDGEKRMKDTANSCMLVSTLIATVLFAAAFTVPGGNVNDRGFQFSYGRKHSQYLLFQMHSVYFLL